MYVGLMSGVEDNLISGAVEDAVQCQGDFHHPQIGAEVSPGLGDPLNQELPNLLGQLPALPGAEPSAVSGRVDSVQNRARRSARRFSGYWHDSKLYARPQIGALI